MTQPESDSTRRAPKVLGIGELLWDALPGGKKLGGAPANFAYHANALGANAQIVSRVGRDQAGAALLERLRELGLGCESVQADPSAPTGLVSVDVGPGGQPRYQIFEGVAWDFIEADGAALAAARNADAICFGSLAQRRDVSRRAIQALVGAAPAEALKVFDVNLRQSYFGIEVLHESLELANALKVNDAELPTLCDLFQVRGDARAQMETLASRFNLRLVACTRGEGGSALLSGGVWSEHPGFKARVVDTVGAGDAFSAALTMGTLSGRALDEVNASANRLAAYVCSCEGGTPTLPPELAGMFES